MSGRRSKIEKLLSKYGFVLLRQHKHKIYRYRDGRNFVIASTPSDRRAEAIALKMLQRFLGTSNQGRHRKQRNRSP